jgi:hypothetical protein
MHAIKSSNATPPSSNNRTGLTSPTITLDSGAGVGDQGLADDGIWSTLRLHDCRFSEKSVAKKLLTQWPRTSKRGFQKKGLIDG